MILLEELEIFIFYVNPDMSLIGKTCKKWDVIGTAQNISLKYGIKMKPHVHMQIKAWFNYESYFAKHY